MECFVYLSNQLLEGPVNDIGNNTHLRSWFTLLALIIMLNVLR